MYHMYVNAYVRSLQIINRIYSMNRCTHFSFSLAITLVTKGNFTSSFDLLAIPIPGFPYDIFRLQMATVGQLVC